MKITAENDRCLSVELTGDDMRKLDITYEELDYANIETRRVLWTLLDEARRIAALGLPRTLPAMQSIGYRQLFSYLDGDCTYDEAVERIGGSDPCTKDLVCPDGSVIFRLTAKKLGLDPAIMAAPLITTILDTCTILVYFNIVTAFYPSL